MVINMWDNRDEIDASLDPDVLHFVNRRSEEISSHFYADTDNCLRYKGSDGFVELNSLRYIIKRAILEGINWKTNEIR